MCWCCRHEAGDLASGITLTVVVLEIIIHIQIILVFIPSDESPRKHLHHRSFSRLWDFKNSVFMQKLLLWDQFLFPSSSRCRGQILVNKDLCVYRSDTLYSYLSCVFYLQIVLELEVKVYATPSLKWLHQLDVWPVSQLPHLTERCN